MMERREKYHRHRPARTETWGFWGPVVPLNDRRYHPAAHGGVVEVEICSCGAQRRTNINGWYRERGDWKSAK